jgi:hypothetical protein
MVSSFNPTHFIFKNERRPQLFQIEEKNGKQPIFIKNKGDLNFFQKWKRNAPIVSQTKFILWLAQLFQIFS